MKSPFKMFFFFLFLFSFFLFGCGNKKTKKTFSKNSSKNQATFSFEKLEEEVQKLKNPKATLQKLLVSMYKTENKKEKGKILTWIGKARATIKKKEEKKFLSLQKEVEQLQSKGKQKEALKKLTALPIFLRKSPYLEKLVSIIYSIKSQQGVYVHGQNLLKKASKLAQYKQFEKAIAILNTFFFLEMKKPADLQDQISMLKNKLIQEKKGYDEELKKLAKLPWHSSFHKDDFYNWEYKPKGSKHWNVHNYSLTGKGSGSGANTSWAILTTIPRTGGGEFDTIEGDELKNCIWELRFKIIDGSGFSFVTRIVKEENKRSTFSLKIPIFKKNVWYQVRVEIKGKKIKLFCLTNLYEKELTAEALEGTIGFLVDRKSTVLFRDLKVKILK